MSLKIVHGDVIESRDKSIHLAIDGDPDDTIWIPMSVIREGIKEAIEEEDFSDIDLLVDTWWFNLYSERFK